MTATPSDRERYSMHTRPSSADDLWLLQNAFTATRSSESIHSADTFGVQAVSSGETPLNSKFSQHCPLPSPPAVLPDSTVPSSKASARTGRHLPYLVTMDRGSPLRRLSQNNAMPLPTFHILPDGFFDEGSSTSHLRMPQEVLQTDAGADTQEILMYPLDSASTLSPAVFAPSPPSVLSREESTISRISGVDPRYLKRRSAIHNPNGHDRHRILDSDVPSGSRSSGDETFLPYFRNPFGGPRGFPGPASPSLRSSRSSSSSGSALSRLTHSKTFSRSSTVATSIANHDSRFPSLPDGLSWLKEITIEVWIDQEGFRPVYPAFRLTGYTPPSASRFLQENRIFKDQSQDLVTLRRVAEDYEDCVGSVDFLPVKRDAFAFHHSALDSPPLIRRVTVNQEESRDYVSRFASLCIKSNGVYSAHGTEALPSRHPQVTPLKLEWKFEYMVMDRRKEGTGKIIPGEKTLTPLRFACSPGLLRPCTGKNVGVVNIFRKKVALKASVQKMEPPRMPLPISPLSPNYRSPKESTSPVPYHRKKLGLWNLHSRSRSHSATANNPRPQTSPSQLDRKERTPLAHPPLRPRAASVGESTPRVRPTNPTQRTPRPHSSDIGRVIAEQIIPRSELAQLSLLDDGNAEQSTKAALTSLTPRHYQETSLAGRGDGGRPSTGLPITTVA